MGDIRVELDDEFDKNFERQGFFTEAWKRRTGPFVISKFYFIFFW